MAWVGRLGAPYRPTVAEALPNGSQRSLAGEWHGVPDEALAPVLTEFING